MEISTQYQHLTGWAREFHVRTGAQWVKLIDPPERDPYAGMGVRTIGRTYLPDGESDSLWQHGSAGALAWVHRFADFYAARPWVYSWEGPNEPHPANKAERKLLAEFERVFTTLLHERGLRSVVYNFGVGWPTDASHWTDLQAGFGGADFLGLHEYSAPTMQDGVENYCLRYRRLLSLDIPYPPILITECGIDGGVIRQGWRAGWKTFSNVTEYAAQLKWYGSECAKDGILSAQVFTAGPAADWYDFEVTQELAWAFPPRSDFVQAPAAPALPPLPPVVVEPEPATPAPYPMIDIRDELPRHNEKQWDTRLVSAVDRIVVHHSGARVPNMPIRDYLKRLALYHIGHHGWAGLAYHYVIGPKGVIWQCNDVTDITSHCGNWAMNGRSVGICLLGNFTKELPTGAQLESLTWLCDSLDLYALGHKEIVKTTCPGSWWDGAKGAINDK